MTVEEVIENELKCVQRDCCRLENECAKCDLVLPKEEIINAYNKALKLETENAELKEQNSKAKELIEDLIKFQPYIDREAFFISLGNEWKTAIYKAEQFLKEE